MFSLLKSEVVWFCFLSSDFLKKFRLPNLNLTILNVLKGELLGITSFMLPGFFFDSILSFQNKVKYIVSTLWKSIRHLHAPINIKLFIDAGCFLRWTKLKWNREIIYLIPSTTIFFFICKQRWWQFFEGNS